MKLIYIVLAAYCKELGKIFFVCEGLPRDPKKYHWICPNCQEPVSHVKQSYNDRIEHFKHKKPTTCDHEPESKAHVLMKRSIFERIMRKTKDVHFIHTEFKIGNQIADIFIIIGPNKLKIAIECQNSKISLNELERRTRGYSEKGVYVLWILNGKGPVLNSPRSFKQADLQNITHCEKRLHQMYRGRIYYVNVDPVNEIVSNIYPLSLINIGKKLKYSIVPGGSINLFRFKIEIFDGLRVAMFYDTYVRRLCEIELRDFFKVNSIRATFKKCTNCSFHQRCKYQKTISEPCSKFKLEDSVVSHSFIIEKFGDRYGFQLIYQSLLILTSEGFLIGEFQDYNRKYKIAT